MKVVLLAGGFGTRLAEETQLKPKPMVEIGAKPILCHIMDIYSQFGFYDFIVACGYKGGVIKEYFDSFHVTNSDWTFDTATGAKSCMGTRAPSWRVSCIDTGLDSLTGGRLLRLKDHLKETFMVTYGDGVGDVDIQQLLDFHRSHGKIATITAVRPPARFGALQLSGQQVTGFSEKNLAHEGWINGGFFVFEPEFLGFIKGNVPLERSPLEGVSAAGELMAYTHAGFWQPMDTIREKQYLEDLWNSGKAPWTPEGRLLSQGLTDGDAGVQKSQGASL